MGGAGTIRGRRAKIASVSPLGRRHASRKGRQLRRAALARIAWVAGQSGEIPLRRTAVILSRTARQSLERCLGGFARIEPTAGSAGGTGGRSHLHTPSVSQLGGNLRRDGRNVGGAG